MKNFSNVRFAIAATAIGGTLLNAGTARAEDCDVTAVDPNRPAVGLFLTEVKAIDETEHDGWGEGVANDALRLVGSASSRSSAGIKSCGIFAHLGDNYQDGTRIGFDKPLALVPVDRFPSEAIASLVLVEEDWSGTNWEALKRDVTSVTTNGWNYGAATGYGALIGVDVGAAFGIYSGGPLILGAVGAVVGWIVDTIVGAVTAAESDIFSPAVLTMGADSRGKLVAAMPGGRKTASATYQGHGGEYLLTFEWRLAAPTRYEGDFNGDHKTDLLVWEDGTKTWEVDLATDTGFRRATWTGAWGSDGPIQVGDFNGDGRDDVMMWRETSKDWTVNLSTGSGFNFLTWTGAWGSDGPIHVGDFNGDGRDDVMMWRATNKDWTVNLSTGSGFNFRVWTGAWGSDGPIHVGDFNGDGRDDVMMWRDANHDWTVNLSTGSGFNFRVWTGAWGSDGPIHVGDFNGDGRDDVMMWREANKDWTVNLSTGSGFNFVTWTGAWGSDGPMRVGDFNADGRDDIMMWREANHDWTVNLSTGSGFNFRTWIGYWGSDGLIQLGDFNGDGRDDVVMRRNSSNDWTMNLSTGTGFTLRNPR